MTIIPYDARGQMYEAMQQSGLSLPNGSAGIIADGEIHRCNVTAKGRAGHDDGAYLLHLHHNFAAGGFENHTDGNGWCKWKYMKPGWRPSSEERRRIDHEVEQARRAHAEHAAQQNEKARKEAIRVWNKADPASETHPYLRRKGLKTRQLRQIVWSDGETVLLVPMRGAGGKIKNLQRIYPDGRKRFLTGGQVKDCYYWIAPPNEQRKIILIAEGWATGMAVFLATGYAVVIAFNAGNLVAVAKWVREQYPESNIIICADDDWKTDGNPGMTEATEAAGAINGKIAVPDFGRDRYEHDTDFNDLHRKSGKAVVKACIDAATDPSSNPHGGGHNHGGDDGDHGDDGEGGEKDEVVKKQTDMLFDLAAASELYHNSARVAFVDFDVNGHRETCQVKSTDFREWLLARYYDLTNSVPNDNAIKNAVNTLAAKAKYKGPEREVYLRVAEHDGRYYLDLCDTEWRAIEIDATGWRVEDEPPVRFYRRPGMRPLPLPKRGGSIEKLREYLNVKNDDDFVLAVSWELATMRPVGPYPALEVNGQDGTCKTTMLRVLRALVDPNVAALRGPPREERDLVIAASNGHIVGYDNLSHLSDWLSDALARISTGGGFGTRQLYTDDDERLFNDKRPILLGGINDVIVQGDLASRTVRLELEPIPDDKRMAEKAYWSAFNLDYPSILGALLDGIVHGLQHLEEAENQLSQQKLPRMADFAVWATACEGAFWKKGTFLRAYWANINAVTRAVVEADLIGNVILRLMGDEEIWSGTATELLHRLEGLAGEREAKSKFWPQSSRALGRRLRRLATPLRRLGIEIDHKRTEDRIITITKARRETTETSETTVRQERRGNVGANLFENNGNDVTDVSDVLFQGSQRDTGNVGENDDLPSADLRTAYPRPSRFVFRPNKAARLERVRRAEQRSKRRADE